MSHARTAPGKRRIRIIANQRDIARGNDPTVGEMLLHGNHCVGLLDDQRSWGRVVEQAVHSCLQALRSLLPIRKIVGAMLNPMT